MVRFLPYILIPVLIIAGLGYWRLNSSKQSSVSKQDTQTLKDSEPVEVPKTLPGATEADRLQSLEDSVSKLTAQMGSSKASGTQAEIPNLNSRLANAESAVTELKARVSSLEKGTTVTTTTSTNKYPLYIPLGSGGGPWGSQDWATLNEYQISINPDNYSGYTGMQLEVNFRLVESAGTGSVRLYNITDGSSISSQVDTSATSFGVKTSGSFKLSGGQKTYTVQMKSSEGKDLFIQSARIKVNF